MVLDNLIFMGHNQKLILARQVALCKGCLDLFKANIPFYNFDNFIFCLKIPKKNVDYFPNKIIERNKNFKNLNNLSKYIFLKMDQIEIQTFGNLRWTLWKWRPFCVW